MGGAAAAVGGVVVGALVGKAATKLAGSLGLPDGMASLVGMGAGIAAGGYIATGAAGTAAGVGPAVAATPAGVPATSPGAPMDLSVPDVSLASGATPPAADPLAMAEPAGGDLFKGAPPGGMLSMGAPAPEPVPVKPPTTSQQMVAAETDPGLKAQPSWLERMFSPERVGDYIAAGIGGYAQADMRKWELERDYEREDELSDRWRREDPGGGGYLTMKPTYRSQGGSY